MDRGFHSFLDATTTPERLRTWVVSLRSYTEPDCILPPPFVTLEYLNFAIKEFREMKLQPSLERALRHKEGLKA